MANPSSTLQTKIGFFHANSKTLTEENQYAFESPYASAHVLFSKELLVDSISYCPDTTTADNFAATNPTIIKKYNQVSLTVVPNTNNQSWYINDGGKWVRPFLNGGLVPDPITNNPSDGFDPKLYKSDGSLIPPTSGVWWVDPYQGMVKFADGYNPVQLSYGIPKLTCYAYIGRTMTDVVSSQESRDYVYVSSIPSVTHVITHNLNSFNVEVTTMAYDNAESGWIEHIPGIVRTDVNTLRIDLTEALNVHVLIRKIG